MIDRNTSGAFRIRAGVAVTAVALASLFSTNLLRAAEQAHVSIDAARIASAGNGRGAAACASCHGAAGEGNATLSAPRIAGLSSAYLDAQLKAFADGRRVNAIMTPIAKALSPAERPAVAAFYARLSNNYVGAVPAPAAADAAAPGLGEQLALHGRWSSELPACVQCHGGSGVGVGDAFPPLAGQPAIYLKNQLRAWQSGSRDPGPQGLMGGIAGKLSAADIDAVAEYFGMEHRLAAPSTEAPAADAASTVQAPASAATTSPALGAGFAPPKDSQIPKSEFGDMVRLGQQIFDDTHRQAPAFVGNTLRCSSCHLDSGRMAGSAPLWAAYVAYPEYRAKNKKVNTFEERLQGCFQYSMNGRAPPLGDPVLVALESYSYWLATGATIDPKLPGRGYPKLPKPALPPDYSRGQLVYRQQCALCHGPDGAGQRANDGGMAFPALWGDESFNWGAGMENIANASAFIEANMPLSRGKTLSVQEAWDVAAYMDSHERPQDPRFLESAEATRQKFHDSADSMYGTKVDGRMLGLGSVKPGGSLREDSTRN
jgi:thiosulfate dehydrogenase